MTLINNLKQTFDERAIDGNDLEGFDETPRQRRKEEEKRRRKGITIINKPSPGKQGTPLRMCATRCSSPMKKLQQSMSNRYSSLPL